MADEKRKMNRPDSKTIQSLRELVKKIAPGLDQPVPPYDEEKRQRLQSKLAEIFGKGKHTEPAHVSDTDGNALLAAGTGHLANEIRQLQGFRVVTRLAHGSRGEVWEGRGPGDKIHLMIFLNARDEVERETAQAAVHELYRRDPGQRHPCWLMPERVHVGEQRLVVIMEPHTGTLANRYAEMDNKTSRGIPLDELKRTLHPLARFLDHTRAQQVRYDLRSDRLLLVGESVKLLDFGIVRDAPAARPESANPKLDDLYVLALLFQELRTGLRPRGDQAERPRYFTPLPPGTRDFVEQGLRDEGRAFRNAEEFFHAVCEIARAEDRLPAQELAQDVPTARLKNAAMETTRIVKAAASEPAPSERATWELAQSMGDTKPPSDPPSLTSVEAAADTLDQVADTLDQVADTLDQVADTTETTRTEPRFRFQRYLGRGNLGEVWEASPCNPEVPAQGTFAVKVIHKETPRVRALSESAGRLRQVDHPHLLVPREVQIHDSVVLVVSQLAQRDLTQRADDCQRQGLPGIPRAELLDHLEPVANALDHLRERHGLLHLNMKPSNIVFVGGRASLADASLEQPRDQELRSILLPVNPHYMPPELFEGRLDPTADQYALAACFVEMFTGSRPFRTDDLDSLMRRQAQGKFDLTRLSRNDMAIVAQALASNPRDRFTSCRRFVEALRRAGDSASQRGSGARSAKLVVENELREVRLLCLNDEQFLARVKDFVAKTGPEVIVSSLGQTVMLFRDQRAPVAQRERGMFLKLTSHSRTPGSGVRLIQATVYSPGRRLQGHDLARRSGLLLRSLREHLIPISAGSSVTAKHIRAAIVGDPFDDC